MILIHELGVLQQVPVQANTSSADEKRMDVSFG